MSLLTSLNLSSTEHGFDQLKAEYDSMLSTQIKAGTKCTYKEFTTVQYEKVLVDEEDPEGDTEFVESKVIAYQYDIYRLVTTNITIPPKEE